MDQVPLIVLGADLDGLVAALALAHQGFPVRVLERGGRGDAAPDVATLTPSAMQELAVLGLADHVQARAAEPVEMTHADGRTGSVLRKVGLGPSVRQRFGRPFLTVRRSDLRGLLVAACDADEMIQVDYDVRAASVEDLGEAVLVTLPGGRRIRAEALVAADGASSPVRELLGGGHATSSPFVLRTAPGPAALGHAGMRLWSSSSLLVVQVPVADHGSEVAVVLRGGHDDDPRHVLHDLASHHPEVRAVAAPALESDAARVFRHHMPLEQCTRHRMTVLGAAAAPMLPHGALATSAAVVDAGALGAAFDRADGRILPALEAYGRSRARHWTRVADRSYDFAQLCHADGLLRRLRDRLWGGAPTDALADVAELPAVR
jgi:2-polyprenyl-6-methoxyphenol hydroxylase-like FAD-dependent oxidoreductase